MRSRGVRTTPARTTTQQRREERREPQPIRKRERGRLPTPTKLPRPGAHFPARMGRGELYEHYKRIGMLDYESC